MKKLIPLFYLLLSSCSTMKPQECVGANWKDIGYNDAIQGRTVWLKSRTEACAKINLQPDTKAYLAGYRSGEKQFCTFRNGFIYGRRGAIEPNICKSTELAKPFNNGYKEGWGEYQDELDRLESFSKFNSFF